MKAVNESLVAPGGPKKESPFDEKGNIKEDCQEFSFNENKSDDKDSSGKSIFKTDSSYRKNLDDQGSKEEEEVKVEEE
jgi:hypothetical protein